jgi:uncharacterized protein YvpB
MMKKTVTGCLLATTLLLGGIVPQMPLFSNGENSILGTSIAEASTSTTYKTTANLNLRTGPSTSYGVILTIPQGKNVTYISQSGSWYKVTYNSHTGYVSSKYLTKVTTTPAATVALNVPYVSQLTPTYAPMGCEGASLLMALKYKGYTNESLKTLLDKMPKTTNNPYIAFAGSPYKIIKGVFQSIFPKPLTAFGQKYNSKVANATGYTTTQLKTEVDKGNPVVVYVTVNFAKPIWSKYNMGSAGYVNIVDNMHVMTLIGYNKTNSSYYVADPNSRSSNNKYWVSKSVFETSYNALKYAVVVR